MNRAIANHFVPIGRRISATKWDVGFPIKGYYERWHVCVQPTPYPRVTHLQWARQSVFFTDESRFSLQFNSCHILNWREAGITLDVLSCETLLRCTKKSGWMFHTIWRAVYYHHCSVDNAWPHCSAVVSQYVDDKGSECMDWPACLPDLNPKRIKYMLL